MARLHEIRLQGLKAALEGEPENGRLWLKVAELLVELERDEEALDAARRAIRHLEDEADSLEARALVLGLGGDPPVAHRETSAEGSSEPEAGSEGPEEGGGARVERPEGGWDDEGGSVHPFRILRGGGGGDVGPDSPGSRESIDFTAVGGMDELKEQIRLDIVLPFQKPEVFAAYGRRRRGGILMYGPPGCGKTLLARATAGECGATFVSVAIDQVLDMWFGESERKLAALFEDARRRAPTVLFFDELEAIGASRQQIRNSPGKTLVNVLLSEMDGVTSDNDRVLVMAATNAPWHVDPALLRPGRFDRVQFVPTPDRAARQRILELHLRDRPTEAELGLGKLADSTEHWSGADLANLVERAVEAPLREALSGGEIRPVTRGDLRAARKAGRPSTRDWFATAKNYAAFANVGGLYDDLQAFLERHRKL